MLSISLHLPIYLIKYMRTLYGEPYAPKACDEIGIYILNVKAAYRSTSTAQKKKCCKPTSSLFAQAITTSVER